MIQQYFWVQPQRKWNLYFKERSAPHIYCSFIHNSHNMEITCAFRQAIPTPSDIIAVIYEIIVQHNTQVFVLMLPQRNLPHWQLDRSVAHTIMYSMYNYVLHIILDHDNKYVICLWIYYIFIVMLECTFLLIKKEFAI